MKIYRMHISPVLGKMKLLDIKNFYPAEEYHENYLNKNPSGYCHIGTHKFENARRTNEN